MKIKITQLTDWQLVLDVARFTQGKQSVSSAVSDQFKRNMLMSQHSPLRVLMFKIEMYDIPVSSSVHIVRHKHGVEHYVQTQRPDITGKPRGTTTNHIMICNAQALINMARVRLCSKASDETVVVFNNINKALYDLDNNLFFASEPNCIWLGRCPEKNSCKPQRLIEVEHNMHWNWLQGIEED